MTAAVSVAVTDAVCVGVLVGEREAVDADELVADAVFELLADELLELDAERVDDADSDVVAVAV